jgi:putative transposase
MPDHLHLLIFVPASSNVSKLMQSIKRNFTRNYKDAQGIDGSLNLWQRSFYDHVIRNERDYLNHVHYIHYNPVKHGYVSRPDDYPHTSYHEYLKRGWYEIGWSPEENAPWLNLYPEP